MSSIQPVTESIQRLNEIMQSAQAKTIDAAMKQVEVAISLSLGQEMGKGQNFDTVA